MGLFKMSSSSSYDKGCNQRPIVNVTVEAPKRKKRKREQVPVSNPNPHNYKILKSRQIKGNLVVEILYPDALNYEGLKILLFKGCTIGHLERQGSIDPHFSSNKRFHSPFARFEPTPLGWKVALTTAKFI